MANKLKSLWNTYRHIGVTPDSTSSEIRHIKAINGIVLIVIALLWLQLPFVIFLLPDTKYILAAFIIWPLFIQLIPLLNHKGAYTAARVLYSLSTILIIIFIAVQLGPETANHFFLVSAIVAFFIIFPIQQTRWLISMSILATAALVGLEWHFMSNGGILDLPDDFLILARWSSMSAFITILIAITGYHYNVVDEAEKNLVKAHQRSESLLLNILPASIAARLKKNEKPIADQVEDASVLFVDLIGFTVLSGQLHHQRLVAILDQLFSEFDRIVTKHGLEKIKMIGDAYMVAGGVAGSSSNHHEAIAACAIEMRDFLLERPIEDAPALGIRLGIHCGPLVAGVICEKKFAYDLWGDTVNIASRMESHSSPNKIQVSKDFMEKTKHRFLYEARGAMEIKGKGAMETFFLIETLKESNYA